MKNEKTKKRDKLNSSKARDVDMQNLEMSLKDEADGFYHFENSLDEYIED